MVAPKRRTRIKINKSDGMCTSSDFRTYFMTVQLLQIENAVPRIRGQSPWIHLPDYLTIGLSDYQLVASRLKTACRIPPCLETSISIGVSRRVFTQKVV